MIANFKTQKISTPQKLSAILKVERKKKKLTLNQIEKITKIKKEYIVALEKGLFKILPEDIYVRGFLRTLANFYQLDPVQLIEKYREETDPQKPQSRKAINFQTNRLREPIAIITPKLITVVLGVVVGLFLIGYLWYEVSGFAIAPRLIIEKPAQAELEINQDKLVIEGKTDNSASLVINQESIPVDQEGRFSQKVRLQSGFNILTIKAVNRSQGETIRQIKVIVNR
jgi:cytoskeletal protein RodZ